MKAHLTLEHSDWTLSADKLGDLQVESLRELVRRAKGAHFTDVDMRRDGQNERHEADWIKHLVETAVSGGDDITKDFWKTKPHTPAERELYASKHPIESRQGLDYDDASRAHNAMGIVARRYPGTSTETPILRTPKGLAMVDINMGSGKDYGKLELHWLAAMDKGAGRAALEHICKVADEHQVTLYGYPAPHDPKKMGDTFRGKAMTQSQLETWYKSFGFVMSKKRDRDGIPLMTRPPKRPDKTAAVKWPRQIVGPEALANYLKGRTEQRAPFSRFTPLQLANQLGKDCVFVLRRISLTSLEYRPYNAAMNHPNPKLIEKYAATDPQTMPPIIVYGRRSNLIWDGEHRARAAQQRGDKTILAYVPKRATP